MKHMCKFLGLYCMKLKFMVKSTFLYYFNLTVNLIILFDGIHSALYLL